jgi:glutaminyl-peptide cyclotransferase
MSLRRAGLTACLATAAAVIAVSGRPALTQRLFHAPIAHYQVTHVYPHDSGAFTQGLSIVNGVLYEGTGLNGQSTIRKVRLDNGEVLQVQKVADEYFGEGIAVWRDRIFELTWRSGIGFIYDRESFSRVGTFNYTGEGWGLTTDGARLIMSDGSASLRFLDPATQRETGRVQVRDGATQVEQLNELEFVKGAVLANVWQTDRVARIDLKTGRVLEWIDFTGLLSPADRAQTADGAVLNGIAYDALHDRLFVTGKLWPKLFEVKIVH